MSLKHVDVDCAAPQFVFDVYCDSLHKVLSMINAQQLDIMDLVAGAALRTMSIQIISGVIALAME